MIQLNPVLFSICSICGQHVHAALHPRTDADTALALHLSAHPQVAGKAQAMLIGSLRHRMTKAVN